MIPAICVIGVAGIGWTVKNPTFGRIIRLIKNINILSKTLRSLIIIVYKKSRISSFWIAVLLSNHLLI